MNKLIEIIKLCRPQQWYKNLVIYLALIFTGQLLLFDKFLIVTAGLASLCLISSANYIINDIIDKKKDIHHPEKKDRPIASGKVHVWEGIIISAVLMASSLFIATKLGSVFTISVLTLFVLSQTYSLILKNQVFLDIILISILFVIRAVSGAFVLKSDISPWLVLCTFFIAMFLATGKRASELVFIGNAAIKHRVALKGYTKDIANNLLIITTTLLLISYSLYSFLSEHRFLLLTIPIAMYTILRYMQLISNGSKIPRHPELAITDLGLIISIVTWTILIIIITTVFK